VVQLTVDGPLATLVLHRPPVNAFDLEMVELLDDAIGKVEASAARCLVIRPETPRVFSAGADIVMLHAATETYSGADELVAFARRFQEVLQRLEDVSFPTIAAIDGLALGGGLELALACDFRLAGPEAKLGLTETSLGLIPGAGGTQRLAALVGRSRARQLILTGQVVDALEADRLGLARRCPEGAVTAATALADDLAGRPARALALAKECVSEAPSAAGYERELTASRELYADPETIALLTEFLNTRERKNKTR
jgi:enoyl-CoA hydratase